MGESTDFIAITEKTLLEFPIEKRGTNGILSPETILEEIRIAYPNARYAQCAFCSRDYVVTGADIGCCRNPRCVFKHIISERMNEQ